MPHLYRMCIPKWKENEPVPFGLVDPNFVTNQVFSVKGPDAQAWKSIIDILFDGTFNYSITQGEKKRGRTCQSSFHNNTLDVMLQLQDLPVNDDTIDIYAVIGQSQIQFMSSYNYTDAVKKRRCPWFCLVLQIFCLDAHSFLNFSICMPLEIKQFKNMLAILEELYEQTW